MPDSVDVTDDAIRVYDEIAERFDAHARSSAHNAYYERPAMFSLMSEIEGRHILDAGCGGGIHSEALVGKGASVVALDASARMVAISRAKLGDSVPVYHHDLRKPAAFLQSSSFDIVLCPLVLVCCPINNLQ